MRHANIQSLRLAATRTLCILLLSTASGAQELLFGTSSNGWTITVDPANGLLVSERVVQGPETWLGLRPATHDGVRLYARDGTPDRLWRMHTADAEKQLVGSMGSAIGFSQGVALEWVPSLGQLIMVNVDAMYAVDKLNGAATFLGVINGLDPFDGVFSLACSPTGALLGFGSQTPFQTGIALYDVDVLARSAGALGYLLVPSGFRVLDLAFRSNGELWASVSTPTSSLNGIYRVDLNSLTLSMVTPILGAPAGIAFGPATVTTSYCSAKVNSNGCSPTILGNGIASVTASSGFNIGCVNVRNQTTGVLTYGFAGAASLPFGGGTMCVSAPRLRAGPWNSGGNFAPLDDCSGTWSFDFNTWASTHPILPIGSTVWAQWIGRDSGFAPPQNYSLSNALEFTLVP